MGKRVVITSIGVVSALGNSMTAIQESFQNQTNAFKLSSCHYKDGVAIPICPIHDFNYLDYCERNKNRRFLSRAGELGAGAAWLAVKESGLSLNQLRETALYVGAGPYLEQEPVNFEARRPLWLLKHLPNTLASFLASCHGLHGESLSIGTACAASLQAIGNGFRAISGGYHKRVLAGGADSRLSEAGMNGYLQAGALYHRADCGASYEPLRGEPCGFIPGEGGAFFILEEYNEAKARQASIYGEIVGFAANCDGYNMTAPRPDGFYQEEAIKLALNEAGIEAGDVSAVSAHGTGTRLNDEMERALLSRLFGANLNGDNQRSQIRIETTKKRIGHLAAACGAVELAFELARLGTFGDGEGQNQSGYSLLENFGFGGQNAVLVIKGGDLE